jgi:glycosyltransferase involved in cell wall biosynthesis
MNSACAVVACKDIGAVPYLIKDGINGYVYNYGDFKTLYQNVKSLLDNNEKRKEISVNAYKTITEEWNAKIAAERVLKLIDSYNGKSLDLEMFKEGPCSRDKKRK